MLFITNGNRSPVESVPSDGSIHTQFLAWDQNPQAAGTLSCSWDWPCGQPERTVMVMNIQTPNFWASMARLSDKHTRVASATRALGKEEESCKIWHWGSVSREWGVAEWERGGGGDALGHRGNRAAQENWGTAHTKAVEEKQGLGLDLMLGALGSLWRLFFGVSFHLQPSQWKAVQWIQGATVSDSSLLQTVQHTGLLLESSGSPETPRGQGQGVGGVEACSASWLLGCRFECRLLVTQGPLPSPLRTLRWQ